MLIAVADLSAHSSRLGLVTLSPASGDPVLVAGEPTSDLGDPLGLLLTLTERHRLKLRDIQGYAVCSDSHPQCEAPLHLLQGLALSQGRPMVGFSRTKALALAAMDQVPLGTALVAIYREEHRLRAGIYRQDLTGGLEELVAEQETTADALKAELGAFGPVAGLGTGSRSLEWGVLLPLLPEQFDILSLDALAAASLVAIRAARSKRTARQHFSINTTNNTTNAAAPSAAFTEWR